MAETISIQTRSEVLAKVRSRGIASTELRSAELCRRFQIHGWRRNQLIDGKPDFFFRRGRVSVLIDGFFWHGYRIYCRRPAANRLYWGAKVSRRKYAIGI